MVGCWLVVDWWLMIARWSPRFLVVVNNQETQHQRSTQNTAARHTHAAALHTNTPSLPPSLSLLPRPNRPARTASRGSACRGASRSRAATTRRCGSRLAATVRRRALQHSPTSGSTSWARWWSTLLCHVSDCVCVCVCAFLCWEMVVLGQLCEGRATAGHVVCSLTCCPPFVLCSLTYARRPSHAPHSPGCLADFPALFWPHLPAFPSFSACQSTCC